jgi:cell wall-associated NlpC family hydrolase
MKSTALFTPENPLHEIDAMKFILLLSILLLSACASVKNDARIADSTATKNLASYARSLIGVPYKFGGDSPGTGFDCSGFVNHVFRHTLGIKLPRSSHEMSHIGPAISKRDLRVGDLVFFNTLRQKFSHVGIYLGDDQFIHAPSSGGRVRMENMRDAYWKKHYEGARRITLRN